MAPITLAQLQDFSAPMVSRNPRLHAVFGTMDLAEERGLGLKSMQTRAKEFNVNARTARRNLSKYADLGLVEAPGDARARKYQTKSNE